MYIHIHIHIYIYGDVAGAAQVGNEKSHTSQLILQFSEPKVQKPMGLRSRASTTRRKKATFNPLEKINVW